MRVYWTSNNNYPFQCKKPNQVSQRIQSLSVLRELLKSSKLGTAVTEVTKKQLSIFFFKIVIINSSTHFIPIFTVTQLLRIKVSVLIIQPVF